MCFPPGRSPPNNPSAVEPCVGGKSCRGAKPPFGPTDPPTNTLTETLNHSTTEPLKHSLTHPLTHSLAHALTRLYMARRRRAHMMAAASLPTAPRAANTTHSPPPTTNHPSNKHPTEGNMARHGHAHRLGDLGLAHQYAHPMAHDAQPSRDRNHSRNWLP